MGEEFFIYLDQSYSLCLPHIYLVLQLGGCEVYISIRIFYWYVLCRANSFYIHIIYSGSYESFRQGWMGVDHRSRCYSQWLYRTKVRQPFFHNLPNEGPWGLSVKGPLRVMSVADWLRGMSSGWGIGWLNSQPQIHYEVISVAITDNRETLDGKFYLNSGLNTDKNI